MRDNDSFILESLYFNNVSSFGISVINEISQRFVDEIKDAVSDKELPFNNIFGDKLRIKVPLKGTGEYSQIINQISQIKNFSHFDPDKKEVVKKIEVDPKYGGGVKYQKINLGRAISSLNIPEEEKKKMLDWFANYSSNIPEMQSMGKYTVVVSRSPIDVLRMSDVGSIKSCHSQGGQYFHCAIQEAKTGGPIAYLVKTEDLGEISEEAFQYDEIFRDKDRGIEGIDPISRLRIRRYRYEEDPNISIGVPETRIYGDRISGFYDTVKSFFKEKQFGENDLDKVSSEFKRKGWVRTGGSYSDSSDSHVFNQMFDTDTFYGSLEHDSQDESQSRWDQFDEELRNFQNRYSFENFSASYDMDNDGDGEDPYYSAWGSLSIPTDELGELSDDFFLMGDDLNEYYEFKRLGRYNPSSENRWDKELPYSFKDKENLARRLSKFIRDFKEFDPTDFADTMWSGIYIRRNATDIHLNCCFGDDCSSSSFNTDDYRNFLEDINSYDGEYDGIVKAFKKALMKNGFIKNIETSNIIEDEDLESNLKNFDMDSSDSNLYTTNTLGPVPTPTGGILEYNPIKTNQYLNQKYPRFLSNYLNTVYRVTPKENPNQMTFKGFLESVQGRKTLEEYGIRCEVSLSLQTDNNLSSLKEGTSYANFTLNIYYDESVLTKELYDLLIFLDNSVEDLFNAARYIVMYEIFNVKNTSTENLKRVYSKYFL
jgi:hypothetical protein